MASLWELILKNNCVVFLSAVYSKILLLEFLLASASLIFRFHDKSSAITLKNMEISGNFLEISELVYSNNSFY